MCRDLGPCLLNVYFTLRKVNPSLIYLVLKNEKDILSLSYVKQTCAKTFSALLFISIRGILYMCVVRDQDQDQEPLNGLIPCERKVRDCNINAPSKDDGRAGVRDVR